MRGGSGGGFAKLSPEARREISRKGALAAHAKGTGHRFTTEEGRAQGRKGGATTLARHGVEHMREIGKRGGITRAARKGVPPAVDAALGGVSGQDRGDV